MSTTAKNNKKNSVTPMMAKYLETKEQYKDCILFYRLGDFYEMFFDDALTASKALEITLTGKDCGLEERAPMCGIPYHAADTYLNRLVAKGYKVAICEQVEDPKQAKGLVKREVIRIVTPGTNLDTNAMDETKHNYLMAIVCMADRFGVSIADISTGDYLVTEVDGCRKLLDEITKFAPTEIICNDSFFVSGVDVEDLKNRLGIAVNALENWYFGDERCKKTLLDHFHVSSLAGLGLGELNCGIIAAGALLYANGNLELAINTLFFNEDGGMVAKLSDSSNVGILVFLVMLGILVALMNKAGGSAAFGRWASTHIHSRAGAQFSTLLLGVMIFVDDYFNCLTVGSVMRPVTDRQKVSRAKLAYLIDATAAPVCIIAPVSSWAAAVTSSVPEGSGINGFTMFLRTIPYNYYALLTIVMSLFLIFTGTDFGSMKLNEDNAKNGDLFTTADRPYGNDVDDGTDTRGHVADLIAPVLVLIVACIFGMIYTGGFFEGVDFVTAFADCNASAGLVLGSSIALLFTFVFYRVRNVMTFQDFAACIPEGFKAMVSPMLILSLAWTLSGMTGLLGAKYYVANLLSGSAAALQYMLPVIIFLVAVFLAFATGTSWGTFSILIPIVCHAFPEGEMLVISIAACLSGAVCGDHCSPISDTTIMASAGAHCSHVNHVSTQLPYAITAASCAAVCYVITGIAQAFLGANGSLFTSLILLAVAIAVELVVLSVIRVRTNKKAAE